MSLSLCHARISEFVDERAKAAFGVLRKILFELGPDFGESNNMDSALGVIGDQFQQTLRASRQHFFTIFRRSFHGGRSRAFGYRNFLHVPHAVLTP